MAQYAVGPQVTQVWTGLGPVLLANQDLVNTVTVGDRPNVFQGAQNADAIPALGSIAYLGDSPLYAIAPAGTAALLVVTGGTSWAPSPAQVALQINALGLAKDSTVSGLPSNLQAMGVPSFIPNLASTSFIGLSAQPPTTFFTFSASSRIWFAHLSFAVATNGSYSGGTTQLYSRIRINSATDLTIVELAVGGPGTNDSGDSDLVINGIKVNNGDTLKADVNNGSAMTNGVMHASGVVLYSTP